MPTQAAIDRNLRVAATLWVLLAADAFGKAAYADPIIVPCRWEQGEQRSFSGTTDAPAVNLQAVFLNVDVKPGDRLFLGESTEQDPTLVEGSVIVQRFDKVPHLYLADSFERVAGV